MARRNIVVCTSGKCGVGVSQDPVTMVAKVQEIELDGYRDLGDIAIVGYYLDAALKSGMDFLHFNIVVKDHVYRELITIQNALNDCNSEPQSVVSTIIKGYPRYSDIARVAKFIDIWTKFKEANHMVFFTRMSEAQRTNRHYSPLASMQKKLVDIAWSELEEKADKERSA